VNKFIAFSGGVESTAMCVLFGKNAKAIFADTGWEHKAMYDRLSMIEDKIKIIHPDFEIIRVKNKKYKSLKEYIKEYKYYPNVFRRYCTGMFKIQPIDEFLENQGDCELMIGLNADEVERTGNHGLLSNVKYSYPLIDNNINRQACVDILKKLGLEPRLPVYMQRGGCVGCFYKSKKEFEAMALLNEKEFDEVVEVEESIQDKREDYFSIRPNIPSMRKLKDSLPKMFKPKDMYKEYIDVETPCGVFCK
jgi:hypothetical protein